MKRIVVVLISLITLTVFGGLVYYGWQNRWGHSDQYTLKDPPVLAMLRRDDSLKLEPGDFDHAVWKQIEPLTVDMLHQVTSPPWSKTLIPKVDIRAFHNGTDAYFLFEWKDEVENRRHAIAQFPDAVAVAFSLVEDPPTSSLMMGFDSPINIWQWKAEWDAEFWKVKTTPPGYTPNSYYSYEPEAKLPVNKKKVVGACQDLVATRPGTITAKEKTQVAGRGRWQDGKWRVIIKRAITTDDAGDRGDAQFKPGKVFMALAVWNGEKGDRGSRKSISDWMILDIKAGGGTAAARRAPAAGGLELFPSAQAAEVSSSKPKKITFPKLNEVTSSEPKEKPRVITIKAKRFEYEPSMINVRQGELVTIRLDALDVTHGFYLDGYGVKIKASPGEIGKATFRADQTGRFTFRCSETCGEFHAYMIGYMMVGTNTQFHVFVIATLCAGALLLVAGVISSRKKTGAS